VIEMEIKVSNIEKHFGDHEVLQGITTNVPEGETLAIIGGSGSGKSTLLNIISGNLQPTSGFIKFNGTDITDLSESKLNRFRRNWGFCFQSGALFGSKTVGENVALPIVEHTDLAPEVIEKMVKIKLDMVGLTGFEDLYPSEISGGMVKRASLARALALDPDVLFCDEPSSGLDPVMSAEIDNLILDLTNKTDITAVIVTHDMESAFTVGDRVLLLNEGTVAIEGTPEDIRSSGDPLVRQFVERRAQGPMSMRQNREQFLREMAGEPYQPETDHPVSSGESS